VFGGHDGRSASVSLTSSAQSRRLRRVRGWLKGCLAVLGALFIVGAAIEVVDRLWALHLASRRLETYALLARIRPDMSRDDVRALLGGSPRPYDWLCEDTTHGITLYVHYSLFDGCYAFVMFRGNRARGFSTSRSSEPGVCVGAPPNWGT
jgi:hypothetical protein